MRLATEVYALTSGLTCDAHELFVQIRRVTVSVPSNIAEGHGRLTNLLFRHFLRNAQGSLNEIEWPESLGYSDGPRSKDLMEQCSEVGRLVKGLLASVRMAWTQLLIPLTSVTPLTPAKAIYQ